MNDLLIFALLFVATGAGWVLGRRSTVGPETPQSNPGGESRGLNYLLDGNGSDVVDSALGDLEVNSETLEIHLALGNLLRKKGEVDRAIRVHRNLLTGSGLPGNQVHQAHLELARDYISAGLLDRAERLLLDRRDESPAQHRASLRYLLEIYQSERDWQRAAEVASELLGGESEPANDGSDSPRQPVAVALAHYYCELAAEELAGGDPRAARKLLGQALSRDRGCVRASLMLGQLEIAGGRYREALKVLRNVREQDPEYISETITDLRKCYRALNEERALREWLQECLLENPSTGLVLAVAEDIQHGDGATAAAEFLSMQLAHRPSLRGLAELIRLRMSTMEGKARDDLGPLQVLVKKLVAERPAYRCFHCGFGGQRLHWSCPGCRYWGTIKSIHNASPD